MTTPLVELSKCRSAVRKKAFSKNEKSSASPNPAGGNRRILANSLVQALIRYLRKNRTFCKTKPLFFFTKARAVHHGS